MKYLVPFATCALLILSNAVTVSAVAQEELTLQDALKNYNQAIAEGDAKQALSFAEQAYALGAKKFNKNAPQMSALAYNLGFILRNTGDMDRAILVLEESLEIGEKAYGKRDLRLIDSLLELAETRIERASGGSLGVNEDRDQAFVLLRRSLSIIRRERGKGDPLYIDTARLAAKLALTLSDAKVRRSGRRYSLEVYKHFRESGTNNPQDLGQSALDVGRYYFAGEKKTQRMAERYLLEAVEQFSTLEQPNILAEVVARASLVGLYEERGDSDLATEHCVAIGLLQADREVADFMPIYFGSMEYPERAARMGTEGYVILELTVTESGGVANPTILETSSERHLFDSAAMTAAKGFRYAPRIENGVPVPTSGVKYKVIFELES